MENSNLPIIFWLLSKKNTDKAALALRDEVYEYFDSELEALRKNLSAISACEISKGEMHLYIPASHSNLENGELFMIFTE